MQIKDKNGSSTPILDWSIWENRCRDFLRNGNKFGNQSDSAHHLDHILRVVSTAGQIAKSESANLNVVLPAAWLHDCVVVPKNSPDRAKASALAADAAIKFLTEQGFESALLPEVHHAIRAHSFSAKVPCESLEARVVQDADRIDALGAIGIARCFAIGGKLDQTFYNETDPFCHSREPLDSQFTVDHFYTKLLRLGQSMQTAAGKVEASRRIDFMSSFLQQLETEIT